MSISLGKWRKTPWLIRLLFLKPPYRRVVRYYAVGSHIDEWEYSWEPLD